MHPCTSGSEPRPWKNWGAKARAAEPNTTKLLGEEAVGEAGRAAAITGGTPNTLYLGLSTGRQGGVDKWGG